MGVIALCHCKENEILCLLLSPWKSETLSQSFGGWRPRWRTLLFSRLWRWRLPSACIKAAAVNDPSSHGHTVTSTETTPGHKWNPFVCLFFFFLTHACCTHAAAFTHVSYVKKYVLCNLITAQINIRSINTWKHWYILCFPIFFVVDDKLLCFCCPW